MQLHISKRITNYTFCPMHWSLELNRSKVNSAQDLRAACWKGKLEIKGFFSSPEYTHVWFNHFIPCLFCFICVTITMLNSLNLPFYCVVLASINGKWKCQVRSWNTKRFKKTPKSNHKNQGEQAGNHQSKQKTGEMVRRWEKLLFFHWLRFWIFFGIVS